MKTANQNLLTRGFTLVEMLLVISLIGIISAVGVPITQSFLFRNDLTETTNLIVNASRSSQIKSRASQNDSIWGIKLQKGLITVFNGTSYASRNTTFDYKTTIPTSVTISGISEYTFSKVFGDPSISGNITLTSGNGVVKTLVLNSKGIINY